MRLRGPGLLAVLCFVAVAVSARADLTLVEKLDSNGGLLPNGDIVIKIKGQMARFDATSEISSIINGKTGEIATLMKDRKILIRISAEKMKAAAEMINKFSGQKQDQAAAKPKPTGRKETINGYEVEEYVVERPNFKGSYWLAPSYPDGAEILKELRGINATVWRRANANAPDYNDFPALPIRTVVETGRAKITTTLVSVKRDPLADSDFAVPTDYQEINPPSFNVSPGKAPVAPMPTETPNPSPQ